MRRRLLGNDRTFEAWANTSVLYVTITPPPSILKQLLR